MAPVADFILANIPLPTLPYYLTHYVPEQTPLSTVSSVVKALAAYLVIIFSTQAFMRSRSALKLQFLFQAHNLILTVGSGVLLVLMLEEVVQLFFKGTLFEAICSSKSWTPVRTFF